MNTVVLSPCQDNFLPPVQCSDAHCKQLEKQITELSAHIHAATYRLLELIREYDDARVATQMNEDYLLQIARYGTAAHVERLV